VIANGIGASLELLQPFVDEIDPDIGVIRFDVPAVGGSSRTDSTAAAADPSGGRRPRRRMSFSTSYPRSRLVGHGLDHGLGDRGAVMPKCGRRGVGWPRGTATSFDTM
jgi:hypothetical protein